MMELADNCDGFDVLSKPGVAVGGNAMTDHDHRRRGPRKHVDGKNGERFRVLARARFPVLQKGANLEYADLRYLQGLWTKIGV